MTHEEQQARIEAIYSRWESVLGLDSWDIGREFYPGTFINQNGNATGDAAVACTFTRWQYLHGSIWFNTAAAADQTDAQMEEHVVHEMVHVLLNEMRDLCTEDEHPINLKHEERVCTTLARAFLRASRTGESA